MRTFHGKPLMHSRHRSRLELSLLSIFGLTWHIGVFVWVREQKMSNKSNAFYLFSNRWFTLFRESPGVISEPSRGHLWVLMYDCYMHTNHSFLSLLWEAAQEYQSDKHLVG